MGKFSTARELIGFLMERKKYWLIPLVVLLLVFGLLIFFGEATGLGPLAYPFI